MEREIEIGEERESGGEEKRRRGSKGREEKR
jgi:hypothetical protein